ncbi:MULTISPECIES: Imm26 family immunity protein [Paenibacillus]|uniref:Imm26 family immunity protein n=1 Tax=Paenibacillus TaxID=44249 RepID=UPI0006C4E96E|nr:MULTISPECIES: Imm26 family immunity protein [Paenibacillus]KOS02835.1 hypothetical protein AM598_10065 [Paenibacillus polymyxa]PNQ82453.1 hypothetical protein C1T21_04370 [Paenibacillus sp. F4]
MVFKRIKHREGDIFVIPLHDCRFEVIFTATQNLTKGVWPIIDQRPLSEEQQQLKYFNCGGHLYCGDEYIRNLELEEYNQYTVMGVAGYELVQQYLAQYEDH